MSAADPALAPDALLAHVVFRVEARPGGALVEMDGWTRTFHAAARDIPVHLGERLAERRAAEAEAIDLGIAIGGGRRVGVDQEAIDQAERDLEDPNLLARTMAEETTAIIDELRAEQLRIATAAAMAGVAEPLPWPVARDRNVAVGHLMVPRCIVDAMVRDVGAAETLRRIQNQVTTVVREAQEEDPAWGRPGSASIMLTEHGPWFDVAHLIVMTGPDLHLEGSAAMLDADPFPDTIVVAAKGRRFGDVVGTGVSTLDEAVIEDAEIEDGRITFTLDAEWDPLRDHPDIGPLLAHEPEATPMDIVDGEWRSAAPDGAAT